MTHIQFDSVFKKYLSDGPYILSNVSFDVNRGDLYGMIGRSGAGKSTLIRSINGLEKVTSGEVRIAGKSITGHTESQFVRLRKNIGMIFQEPSLISSRSVFQNVALPLIVNGTPRREIAGKVNSILETVGLADKIHSFPAQLSGGQKQRVGIARAMVYDPDILLCDEPTSALDPETAVSILDILQRINKELGKTVVLITHDFSIVKRLCNRVAVIDAGRIVENDVVWKVFGTPLHHTTKELLSPFQSTEGSALLRSTDKTAFFRIRFDGNGNKDLGTLLTDAARHARVVSSNISIIDGRSVGDIIISIDNENLDLVSLKKISENINIDHIK